MKFNELPEWAKQEVTATVTRWYVEKGEAEYGKENLDACVKEYIDDHDNFTIDYDEETGEAVGVDW